MKINAAICAAPDCSHAHPYEYRFRRVHGPATRVSVSSLFAGVAMPEKLLDCLLAIVLGLLWAALSMDFFDVLIR